jgi:alkylation response protein AidB-like acyl-CoA dehydrogenase
MDQDILLTAPKDDYRACLRDAYEAVILPEAHIWEAQGHIARQAWIELARIGLFRLPITGPEAWRSALALEELGYLGFAGIRASIGVNGFMAPYYIANYGSPELKSRFQEQIRSGQCVAALAITETGSGSDLRRISCTAELESPEFLLVNGQKRFIANGGHADIFVTLVKTDRAPRANDLASSSFLVVENTSCCVETRPEPMLGWRSADVCAVTFQNCHVDSANLIGRPNMGMMQLIPALDFERLVAGTLALGGARKAIEFGLEVANKPSDSGRNLGEHQAVSHPLANHFAQLRLLESYAEAAWRKQGAGQLDTAIASTLKLQATELELDSALNALRFGGASAYAKGSAFARLHRDAVAGTVAAGPNELIRDILYREAVAAKSAAPPSRNVPVPDPRKM